ncbi:MAG: hypothetical protein IPI42_06430 [Saprospiraceae bacterium]|nr:hypothetical protein [Candidatus Parvibacillus calidus]
MMMFFPPPINRPALTFYRWWWYGHKDYIASQVIYPIRITYRRVMATCRPVQDIPPINLDGYYSIRGFSSFGFPFYLIKSNVSLNVNGLMINAPSKINSRINHSRSKNVGGA